MGRHIARDDQMLAAAAAVQPELTVRAHGIGPLIDIGVPCGLIG
eukprot:gene9798-12031_t